MASQTRAGGIRPSRAGRYVVYREQADLCDRAARELGLANVVYRRFPEGEFIAGDRDGDHLLFCARTFAPIRPAPRPVGGRVEQGRLELRSTASLAVGEAL